MGEIVEINQEILHLARLALTGRHQDIHLFIRRLANKLKASNQELAEQLNQLLLESPTREAPLRGEAIAAIPVDQDSRLQLARYEHPVQLLKEPIWAAGVKERLEQLIAERLHENDLLQASLSPSRSVLFTGPPGVGKTLAARWIASKLNLPLIVLDLAAVMSSYLGRTGNNIRYLLDYAKSVNCILLLDEFDAVAKRRDDDSEIGELKRLVTVLLQEIDDWPPTGLLIAATNHSNLLDPAIWRRFDIIVDFPMPTDEQVYEAVCKFLGPVDSKLNSWREIVALVFRGSSFSDVERELLHARRESVILKKNLKECLISLALGKLSLVPDEARIQIAVELEKSGFSQREASEWTGVARKTIRKYRDNTRGKRTGG